MSFKERFNEFIKRINVKKVLFGVMCTLLVMVIVLGCVVGGKFARMMSGLNQGTVSSQPTETDPSTAPDETGSTQGETQIPTTDPEQTTLPTEPGHVHEFVLTESVAATCKNYGYNIYTCSCGKQDIPLDEQVEPYGHSFGAGETVSATCTAPGCTRFVCSRCGEVEERNNVAALGHNFQLIEVVAPTCELDGYTLYRCANCGQEEKDEVELALKHDYELVEHTDVSCTSDECSVYQCKNCGEANRVYGEASTGHAWTDWEQITDSSWTRACSKCGVTESSADIAITNRQVSSDYVHDASGNRYKLYIIYVGTATTPDLFHYTINDYLDNGTLGYHYDTTQGLIVSYTNGAGEKTTVTLPVFQSVATTIPADAG